MVEVAYEWANEQLWLPDLFVSNLRTLTHTGYLDHPGVQVEVKPDKTVVYTRFARISFLCPMRFDGFPFDVHVCDFKVYSPENPADRVKFEYNPGGSGIAWRTQTVLEHRVAFLPLTPDERQAIINRYHRYNLSIGGRGWDTPWRSFWPQSPLCS